MKGSDEGNALRRGPRRAMRGSPLETIRWRARAAFQSLFGGGGGEVKPPRRVTSADPVWLDPEHWRRLLVFVHVPKAAGSSINDVLWQVYGRTCHVQHERLSGSGQAGMDRAWASRTLALSGHFPFGYHRIFGAREGEILPGDGLFEGREIRYISVMREPAERLHSYYRFVTSNPLHRLHASTKGLGCTAFFEKMNAIRNGECRNLQFSMIAGKGGSLRDAIQLVREKYLAVVPVHGIPELIGKMERELGWPEGRARLHRKNPGPERSSEEEMAFLRKYANENCPLDCRLYQYVAMKFAEEFGTDGPGPGSGEGEGNRG